MHKFITAFNLISVISFWVYLSPKDHYQLPETFALLLVIAVLFAMVLFFLAIILGSIIAGIDWIIGKIVSYFKHKYKQS